VGHPNSSFFQEVEGIAADGTHWAAWHQRSTQRAPTCWLGLARKPVLAIVNIEYRFVVLG
jgi:hypothetical protein